MICVAVARLPGDEAEKRYRIVLGGFASSPKRVKEAEANLSKVEDIYTVADVARRTYAFAGDVWASSEYRAHAAGVLVRRLVMEITN